MYLGSYFKILAGIAGIVALYFIFRHWKRIQKFVEEVVAELQKVNWTPRQDLINATLVVIASAICLGAFITLTDLVVSRGLNLILR
ncbi:MAG: preprotein translocase subunit SecE [Candidatus Omnitrophica bacterium]|nr:preprotein translocase subunit SecE [Candidatus Omnitrophota bacterium]